VHYYVPSDDTATPHGCQGGQHLLGSRAWGDIIELLSTVDAGDR
jgi:hypothetical protein